MQIIDLASLRAEATRLLSTLVPGAKATLITLTGELGAGKTAFTQALATELGIDEPVTSPTFVLEKIYTLSDQRFSRLAHIDAYRLKGGSELAALGFDELMNDSTTLVVLEWPERVADMLPPATVAMTIVVNTDGSRTISYA